MWASLSALDLRVSTGTFGEDSEEFIAECMSQGFWPIWLTLNRRGRGSVTVELTSLTTEELNLFERIVVEAISAARLVTQDLDDAAEKELDFEGDVPMRLLRSSPPQLIRKINVEMTPADKAHYAFEEDLPKAVLVEDLWRLNPEDLVGIDESVWGELVDEEDRNKPEGRSLAELI